MPTILLILALLSCAFTAALTANAAAQTEAEIWSAPVNLSRSGAAEQPRIVAAPDGTVQVFWWDRFDGMMTAYSEGEVWSAPASAPILVLGPGGFFTPIGVMPTMVADARGWVHAFWYGDADRETGLRPLLHSQMPIGGTTWSGVQVAAESAVAFDVATAPSGALTLAYVRTLHRADGSAGVYVRRTAGGGAGWGNGLPAYETIYFRLLTAEQAYVRVADTGDGMIHLAWEDTQLGQALYARSTDDGLSWTAPEELGQPDQYAAHPRVLALGGGNALRLWETGGGCRLYQQEFTATQTMTATWSTPKRVLQEVTTCPRGERSWPFGQGAIWLWGEGSGALAVTAWDRTRSLWSEPRSLSVRFQDPDSGRWVGLAELQAAPAGDTLLVTGSDPTAGEVWVVRTEVSALELAFAPPSPWSAPVLLSEPGAPVEWPAVAVDLAGNVHVVWSQADRAEGPGTALHYARFDGVHWSRAVELISASGGEMARQPALLADGQGVLHLAWSGGDQGQIFYTRAQANQAASLGGWSAPEPVSSAWVAGSWPQLGLDASGRLYISYAVPLNEGRGIYLVRSEDGGASWSEPVQVFDAVAAGWATVDHPALAVAPDGTLDLAWVQGALPGTWPARGIYYARSSDGGLSWSDPSEVAGSGYDWPRLAMAGGEVHLLYSGENGGIWHRRHTASEEAGTGWGTPMRVPGQESALGPFGLAATGPAWGTGGTLHLVAGDAEERSLRYGTWDGTAWKSAERLELEPQAVGALGLAAAARAEGGRLAVGIRALAEGEGGTTLPAVLVAARAIPTAESPPAPTPVATVAPQATPTSEATPCPAPSPTPDLRGGPARSGGSLPALPLAGGLAAAIVVGVLAAWGLRRRRP